eukprot:m.232680 g.232680  ORF g.232680 m.232680 type:complete len:388 (-) comp12393_c0_seq1:204-1367(-)
MSETGDRDPEDTEGQVNAFAGTSSPPPFRKSSQSHRRIYSRSPDHGRRSEPLLEVSFPNLGELAGGANEQTQESDEYTDQADAADTDDGLPMTGSPGKGPRKETVGRHVPVPRPEGEVSLVVGGRRFVCQASLFQQHPNTMLGRMFGSSLDTKLSRPNDNGDYVITHDVTSAAFHAILNFYKSGQIRCPPNVSVAELHEACTFFMIPFTHTSVKCENLGQLLQQLSNQGARSQFEEFIEESILPAMARSAQLGERECHIVCLSDDDCLVWDDDLPPRLGEQWAQVIHSTRLVRFMRDHENQTLAKQLLKEKGLKGIRIGIEGFPTYVDKIRTGPTGEKLEVEYNYEQRPFIRVSWAVEEGKSRHVDFQCVRLRTASTASAALSQNPM